MSLVVKGYVPEPEAATLELGAKVTQAKAKRAHVSVAVMLHGPAGQIGHLAMDPVVKG